MQNERNSRKGKKSQSRTAELYCRISTKPQNMHTGQAHMDIENTTRQGETSNTPCEILVRDTSGLGLQHLQFFQLLQTYFLL